MANEEIKRIIKDSNIKFWKVAKEIGITDGNFSRKLRTEFTDKEKEKILNIIEKLKERED